MSEEEREVERVEENGAKGEQQSESGSGQGRTWYPYITKVQFEKFLSRLENNTPDVIDRDYVRAIIRTPSMIYRFLRGIEAMRLIDRDQQPTDHLRMLVAPETRKQAFAEVVRDLYPELLEQCDQNIGDLQDRDIVSFFRKSTGMGNDSANKMKMFFKFLAGEADFEASPVAPPVPESEPGEDTPEPTAEEQKDQPAEEQKDQPAEPESEPESEAEPEAEPAAKPAPATSPPTGRGSRPQRDRSQASQQRDEGGRSQQRDEGGRSQQRDEGGRSQQRDEGGRSQQRDEGGRSQQQRSEGGRSQQQRNEAPSQTGGERSSGSDRPLSEAQKAYLETLKSVLNINIDGDWDDDMIRLIFDRLERLFDRVRRS